MSEAAHIIMPAPAKVNLYLKVVGKRPDGYHDIVSVMQALELADELAITRTRGGIEVVCDDLDVPTGEDNIAYRAAFSLLGGHAALGGVRIEIKKRIPVAAGLGGGSSDAAAALKGVNSLFGLGFSDAGLREVGLSLGADVPFFISWPSALARGVGEALTRLPSPEEIWLVLVNPGFAVSTRWVYENLSLKMGLTNGDNSITLPPFKGQTYDAGLLVSCLHNDLERVTVGRYPQIKEIKERLSGEGALGALMSGSGPTVFGVFKGRHEAESAALRLKVPGWTALVTRTISVWPEAVV